MTGKTPSYQVVMKLSKFSSLFPDLRLFVQLNDNLEAPEAKLTNDYLMEYTMNDEMMMEHQLSPIERFRWYLGQGDGVRK
jgi:hypothetical protein